MRNCVDCGGLFDPIFEQAILCENCTNLPVELQCHEHLRLGEGMLECEIARKSHFPDMPHVWQGRIGDKQVYIEWK